MTREDDVRAAIEAGASALGFVLAPSRRQVSLARARGLVRAAGSVDTVAVMVDPEPGEIEVALEIFRFVQLHGRETPAQCALYPGRVWKALPGESFRSAGEYRVAAYLLDGATPGSGETFAWELLRGWTRPGPLWLAGGLHPGNVGRAIAEVAPDGVDVSSGVEKSPGCKDPGLMRAFCLAAATS